MHRSFRPAANTMTAAVVQINGIYFFVFLSDKAKVKVCRQTGNEDKEQHIISIWNYKYIVRENSESQNLVTSFEFDNKE